MKEKEYIHMTCIVILMEFTLKREGLRIKKVGLKILTLKRDSNLWDFWEKNQHTTAKIPIILFLKKNLNIARKDKINLNFLGLKINIHWK